MPREAAWARLTGPEGFHVRPADPSNGESYEVTSPAGQRFSGTVELDLPGQTLLGTVRELSDGLFRLLTWTDATGNTGVWASLATYTGDPVVVREFAARAQAALEQLFERRA